MHDNVRPETKIFLSKIRCKAVCVDAADRFHLTVYDVINYNDVSSATATNTYVFVENVGYILLIYRLLIFLKSNTLILCTY